jgi:hypothetical protein
MASLKPLKSVAHNLPHHFASTLNWWGDDYAINHLARAVTAQPGMRIEIDVLHQASAPALQGVAGEAVAAMTATLGQLLEKAGFDPAILSSATIAYDFGVSRSDPVHGLPCYDCTCTLGTPDGRTFSASLTEADS